MFNLWNQGTFKGFFDDSFSFSVQVPELLFNPSDVGIEQMGLTEAITHAVKSLPKEVSTTSIPPALVNP